MGYSRFWLKVADEESKSLPHEFPRSHWLKATGQCVIERYLSATMTIFTFALTDYWHDRRAYVNGSFRSGSFRSWSFRPNVLSISFGRSFQPIISSHELSCSQGELIVYPCSSLRPSTIFKYLLTTAWPIKAKIFVEPPSGDGTKVYIHGPGHIT